MEKMPPSNGGRGMSNLIHSRFSTDFQPEMAPSTSFTLIGWTQTSGKKIEMMWIDYLMFIRNLHITGVGSNIPGGIV